MVRCVSYCGKLVTSRVPAWHGRCSFSSTIRSGYITRVETMRVYQSQSCRAILAALILDIIGVVTLLGKYQIVMCWKLRRNRWQSPPSDFRCLLKSNRCCCCLWRRRLITEDRFTCYLDHLSLWGQFVRGMILSAQGKCALTASTRCSTDMVWSQITALRVWSVVPTSGV